MCKYCMKVLGYIKSITASCNYKDGHSMLYTRLRLDSMQLSIMLCCSALKFDLLCMLINIELCSIYQPLYMHIVKDRFYLRDLMFAGITCWFLAWVLLSCSQTGTEWKRPNRTVTSVTGSRSQHYNSCYTLTITVCNYSNHQKS